MAKTEKADKVKGMERGKDILLLCEKENLPGEMLGTLPDVVWVNGADWPRLVIVDCTRERALENATNFLRHRVPVVFWNAQDAQWSELCFLGRTARRNKVESALLGSYRWLPAIATVKEIASGGCLGADLRLAASFPKGSALGWARAQDCVQWIANQKQLDVRESSDGLLHLRLQGTAGALALNACLDGCCADCVVTIFEKKHERKIPVANPARVELGALRFWLPPTGKVNDLSLLMPLP